MSTSIDSVSKYNTNTYILNDFSEIAFIVCKLASPSDLGTTSHELQPQQTLDRLKDAEKQFRQASILVALDPENLELYTFFKKADLLKDQKAIWQRFTQVSRMNSCQLARKSASRLLDLLKPDFAQVYRLFTAAIISSVQVSVNGFSSAYAITSGVYLVPSSHTSASLDSVSTSSSKIWYLKRIVLQILATGQLVLIVQQAKSGPLIQLSDLLDDKQEDTLSIQKLENVYLAPTGQIARYANIYRANTLKGAKDSADDKRRPDDQMPMYRAWIKLVIDWLLHKYGKIYATESDIDWIEIEIPLVEAKTDEKDQTSRSTIWKSVLWPADLTYTFQGESVHQPLVEVSQCDPFAFAHDWFVNAAERNSSLAALNTTPTATKHDATGEDMVFDIETAYEDQDLVQSYGPPPSAPSQIVYPTPPDGPAAHPTPGMSSVDGLAPTPHSGMQQGYIPLDLGPELEMQDTADFEGVLQSNERNAEDLFGEMTDDAFRLIESNAEPNWDFFDQPAFDVPAKNGFDAAASDIKRQTRMDDISNALPREANTFQEFQSSHEQHESLMFDTIETQSTSLDMDLKEYNSYTHNHDTHAKAGGTALELQQVDMDGQRTNVQNPVKPTNKYLPQMSRKSSIYDNVGLPSTPITYDSKYKSQGRYWFRPVAAANAAPDSIYSVSVATQVKSPGSDTSTSSSEGSVSDNDNGDNNYGYDDHHQGKAWTEYDVRLDEEDGYDHDPNDIDSSYSDLLALLEVISSAPGDEPFLHDFTQSYRTKDQAFQPSKFENIVAQIVVDQITQSSFYGILEPLSFRHPFQLAEIEVSVDHNEARNIVSSLTLGELTDDSTRSPTSQGARIVSLPKPSVIVYRGDNKLQADATILQFWDILGLHPVHGSKNITSFCFYPARSELTDSCSTFLSTISDAYSSGNFGSHMRGAVNEFTQDGLVPWNGLPNEFQDLNDYSQQFGTALAATAGIQDFIMIYMISPDSDLKYCRSLCHAFALLFEAYAKATHPQSGQIELALQLIPMSFIANCETPTIPLQAQYQNLAIEVYNRLPVKMENSPPAMCGSAVVLGELLPRRIEFELSTGIVDPLSRDGKCLHVAYAYSSDYRWLVAAWTDTRGEVALSMSYRLTGQGNNSRFRQEIFQDLWDISHEIMSRETTRWRLAIAKAEHFQLDELNDWLQLINQANQDRKILTKILLLSVKLDPSIMLQTQESLVKSAPILSAGNPVATPVTTPQNSTTSPDHGVPATPTSLSTGMSQNIAESPSEQPMETVIDTDMLLVDPREDSWSAIFSFGLNQMVEGMPSRPAGASGLLLKATGTNNEHTTMTYIEVNLLATSRSGPANPSQAEREAILHDILVQYRCLVTLAMTRGCIETDLDCVPWHIATAVKGAKVLGRVF